MNEETTRQKGAPHRGSARLDGEPGNIAATELLAFAETLVREASGGQIQVTDLSLHVLRPGTSNRVTGEAACLRHSGNPIWRVSITDEAGTTMAEITLMIAGKDAPKADIVPLEPRRKSDPKDRRARIAVAARDVFAEKGYTAATMRDIAAAAEMHVPTMYQYFRSKDEILELVYSWTINQAVDGMEEVLAETGPADVRIDHVVERLHAVNAELRRGTLVMNRETRSLTRAARERVLGRYSEMVRHIGEVIAEGQQQGVFRKMDPQLAAVFIDALADVWVLRPFAVGHAEENAYAAELVTFVRGALQGDTANNPGSPVTSKPN